MTSGSRVVALDLNNLLTTSYTPATNLAVGRYEVLITAKNSSGSTASDSYFFDITRLSLTAPGGGSFDTTPVFKWTDVPGSSRYDIWVNQVLPTPQAQVLRNQFVPSNSYETQVALSAGAFVPTMQTVSQVTGACRNHSRLIELASLRLQRSR